MDRGALRKFHHHPAMSRAFVKEQDAGPEDGTGELPLSPHPNYVTPRGLAQLRARQEQAQQRLATLPRESFGAELEKARIERELRWLAARVNSVILVDPARQPVDRVAFGAEVELADAATGAGQRYRIVGEDEADPEHGLVSWVSPLARALGGARVGDIVTWPRPAGELELEVLAIRYPAP